MLFPVVVVNPFVRRQTRESGFSHFEGTWEEMVERVRATCVAGHAVPGYRDGVLEVPVDPQGVFSGIVQLKAGDRLSGVFAGRTEGENPRKQFFVEGAKMPAAQATVILYRADVLAEDGDNTLDPAKEGWEIISLNASPVEGPMPMDPMTLCANQFLGGVEGHHATQTHLSEADFVARLRDSFLFWQDKAMAGA